MTFHRDDYSASKLSPVPRCQPHGDLVTIGFCRGLRWSKMWSAQAFCSHYTIPQQLWSAGGGHFAKTILSHERHTVFQNPQWWDNRFPSHDHHCERGLPGESSSASPWRRRSKPTGTVWQKDDSEGQWQIWLSAEFYFRPWHVSACALTACLWLFLKVKMTLKRRGLLSLRSCGDSVTLAMKPRSWHWWMATLFGEQSPFCPLSAMDFLLLSAICYWSPEWLPRASFLCLLQWSIRVQVDLRLSQ